MVNEIVIIATLRGYQTEFPYRPSKNAEKGFHSIGMAWRRNTASVTWSIPADKLAEAVQFIDYWYCKQAEPGRERYGVRIAESEEQIQEAA